MIDQTPSEVINLEPLVVFRFREVSAVASCEGDDQWFWTVNCGHHNSYEYNGQGMSFKEALTDAGL